MTYCVCGLWFLKRRDVDKGERNKDKMEATGLTRQIRNIASRTASYCE